MAATDDTEVNREVSEAAEARRLFCNVVDDPALSSFQVPSIVDRSPVIVAISSSAWPRCWPAACANASNRCSTTHWASWPDWPSATASASAPATPTWAPGAASDWLLDGPVAGLLRQQRPDQAEAALAAALDQPLRPAEGSVVLVGAGPGTPAS